MTGLLILKYRARGGWNVVQSLWPIFIYFVGLLAMCICRGRDKERILRGREGGERGGERGGGGERRRGREGGERERGRKGGEKERL